MDPNNLAVNSVISPRPISSFMEGVQFCAVTLPTSEGMRLGNTPDNHREIQSRILMILSSLSLWYQSSAHDNQRGRV